MAGTAAIVPMVSFRGVVKRFGALTACDDVSFDVAAGEVVALLGENGAGKSTLMKTLYGIHPPDAGQVLVEGHPVAFTRPAEAMAAGIGMVFQTFSLLPALTVRDNLAMAWPGTPWFLGPQGRNARGALTRLAQLAPGIDPDARLGTLSTGEQQLVELTKVLNLSARLVILDEPTSVLTPAEAERLYGLIRDLAADGVAVVLITHKLADVEACADRVVVMRRGRIAGTGTASAMTRAAIVAMMMGDTGVRGGDPRGLPPRPDLPARPYPQLLLRDVTTGTAPADAKGITLTVNRGEILGIAGVTGNGQTALAEAVVGIRELTAGEVLLDGKTISRRRLEPRQPLAIGYVPENPRENGIVPGLSLAANLALRGIARPRQHTMHPEQVTQCLTDYDVRPPDPGRAAGTLSGGNVQKLVIARETGEQRDALLMVFPTMGLDITATASVYHRMVDAARAGAAVLWISEELDDLLELAHRIAVIRDGRISSGLPVTPQVTRAEIGALMTGGQP
ncbi:ABC transporter ATP-binding protein [Chachezhania antarctica]|uniref:ABC transporter ATP-binding protein n=1 Tax=Chachezhania antarctica TaxID=2340860 RepID=UPI0013CE8327|nr:ATP-binding cassette domain-containing protein [Chachezhania antarctica]|tara:strand:+ start:3432 stop:4955 length:1524 start_codon:yes stop_codon:yes gene_type:complete